MIIFTLNYNSSSAASEIFGHTFERITNIYYPLWFVFSLFIGLALFRSCDYILSTQKITVSITVILYLIVILSLLNIFKTTYYLFWPETLRAFLIYLFIGYSIKKYNVLSDFLQSVWCYPIILLYIAFVIIGRELILEKLPFINPMSSFYIITLLTSLCGFLMVMKLCQFLIKFKFLTNILTTLGRKSFFILAFHTLIGNFVLTPFFDHFFVDSVAIDVLNFALTIIFCVAMHMLVEKIPFLAYFMLPAKKKSLAVETGELRESTFGFLKLSRLMVYTKRRK